jgi:hypothetical protein
MAATRRISPAAPLGGALVLALLALWTPVGERLPAACGSPQQAADRAERELPATGLVWGRLRAFERVGGGWLLTWQPAHGSWLLRAWVPDPGGVVRWRLEAADWLPGVRLPREVAQRFAPGGELAAISRDLVGRRDWVGGGERLLGALRGGGGLPTAKGSGHSPWEAVLAGLILAGAVARRLDVKDVVPAWRHGIMWAAVAALPGLVQCAALSGNTFVLGVRPWVGQLAFVSAALLLVGALAFGAMRFPAVASPSSPSLLALALAAGTLAGRAAPVSWVGGTAGLPTAVLLWPALAVLAGWLAALAGDGLTALLPRQVPRRVVAAAIAVMAVLGGGPWLGAVLATSVAAAGRRGAGTGAASTLTLGWLTGNVLVSAGWPAAQMSALGVLLAASAIVAFATTRRDQRVPWSGRI